MKYIGFICCFYFITIIPANTQRWEALDSLFTYHFDKKDYQQANEFAQQALDAFMEEGGQPDSTQCKLLDNLAYTYYNLQQFQEALIPYEKARALSLADSTISMKLRIRIHNNIGSIYKIISRPKEAIPYYEAALGFTEEYLGKEHLQYGHALNNLGTTYEDAKDFRKAMDYSNQVQTIFERYKTEGIGAYIMGLNNRASIHFSQSEYHKALPLIQEVEQITRERFGTASLTYLGYNINLGMTYLMLGSYDQAANILVPSADSIQLKYGKTDSKYLSILNSLGGLYKEMSEYEKSIDYFRQSQHLADSLFDQNHRLYKSSLRNLGFNFERLGLYNKAFGHYWKLQQILDGQKQEDINASSSLSLLFAKLGQFEQALQLQLDVIEKFKLKYGEDKQEYWFRVNDLASLYHRVKSFDKATSIYETVVKWFEENNKTDMYQYATVLSNLGSVYDTQGKQKEAISILLKAKTVAEETQGVKHKSYASILQNLASAYSKDQQIEKAIEYYLMALDYEKQYSYQQLNMAVTLSNLANLYLEIKEYEKAYERFHELRDVLLKRMEGTFFILSEAERENFFENLIIRYFNNFSLFVYKSSASFPAGLPFLYDNALIQKGLLLKSSQTVATALSQEKDSSQIQQFKSLKSIRQILEKQYSSVVKSRGLNLDSLEQVAKIIERNLLLNSKAFKQFEEQVKWTDVEETLETEEAAIEFVSFHGKDSSGVENTQYVALVLRPGYSSPKLVSLCDQKQLDDFLSKKIYPINNYIDSLYRGAHLYELIWAPIDSLLEGVDQVYYAPTGLLNRVAFAALKTANGEILADRYDLQLLGSTRQIPESKRITAEARPTYGIIYGGIAYEADSAALARVLPDKIEHDGFSRGLDFIARDSTRGIHWNPLDTTLVELEKLEQLFKQSGLFTMAHRDYQANEESFKIIGEAYPSPDILHVATHGYFFKKAEKETLERQVLEPNGRSIIESSENPLRRSGLILAGANEAWVKGITIEGFEDGILTASEISKMNLSHTKIAVLSACNTAMGDVQGLEGVYGLQRAFKMAGVHYLLLTLWSIPDSHHTVEFMESFYGNWLKKGLSIPASFRQAQATMRAKYPDPYYWAGFVLIE